MTTKATSRPEGRPQPSRIARQAALVQTQSWIPRDASLVRVNEAAKPKLNSGVRIGVEHCFISD